MEEQDIKYPEYGFASHVGYGTAKHQEALVKHGVTVLHRKSFAPIKKLLLDGSMKDRANSVRISSTSTKSIGDAAENTATA